MFVVLELVYLLEEDEEDEEDEEKEDSREKRRKTVQFIDEKGHLLTPPAL